MSISDQDWKFMEEVAAYYRTTNRSVNGTAKKFGINRAKARKILVTMGEIDSAITREAQTLREEGLSLNEIAAKMGYSVSTISSFLPYENEYHQTAEPTKHAAAVREYRTYEKQQKARQENLKLEKRSQPGEELEGQKEEGSMKEADRNWKKEWEKEKAMSYQMDASRPQRFTWEDLENCDVEEVRLAVKEMHKEEEAKRLQLEEELVSLLEIPREKWTEEQNEKFYDLVVLLGLHPGALATRSKYELEKLSEERLPYEPGKVLRLHLDLMEPDWASDIEVEWPSESISTALQKYAHVKGRTISRDVVVPADIPLYALHFVIQRIFGWQHSHLHRFILPNSQVKEFCENRTEQYIKMIGIVFQSPVMDENAAYWTDDYDGGSFKNWLRRKYTGPYLSQCSEEGLYACREDMEKYQPEEEIYVAYHRFKKKDRETGEETEVYRWPFIAGFVKNGPVKEREDRLIKRMKVKDIPFDELPHLFRYGVFQLLERLPISSVLVPGFDRLLPPPEYLAESKEDQANRDEAQEYVDLQLCKTVTQELSQIQGDIDAALEADEDSPYNQVHPLPFTDTLIYNYDFGDNWYVKITASYDCADLIKEGVVDQDTLDKANIKCRETYRPVLIAKDGDMLMDDPGGLSGFVDFLETVNPDLENLDPAQRRKAKEQKKEMLAWAKMQEWNKNNTVSLANLI